MAKKDGKKKKDDAEFPVSADNVKLNGHELDGMPDVSDIVEAAANPVAAVPPPSEPSAPSAPSAPSEPLVPVAPPVPAPTPPVAPPAPTAMSESRSPAVPAPASAPGPRAWSADDLSDAVLVPLQVARSVLPTSRTSVVLGVAALGLLGVLDWPAALGIGLSWEALRRWGPEAAPGGPGRDR